MNPHCTTALGVTYIEGVAWDLSERRMKMDPKDVRLCAEESGLEELWEICGCYSTHLCAGGGSYSGPDETCPDCHGKGELPHIGPHNTVYLEAWFWKHPNLPYLLLEEFGLAGNSVRDHAWTFKQEPDGRVQAVVAVIATAIRESKK